MRSKNLFSLPPALSQSSFLCHLSIGFSLEVGAEEWQWINVHSELIKATLLRDDCVNYETAYNSLPQSHLLPLYNSSILFTCIFVLQINAVEIVYRNFITIKLQNIFQLELCFQLTVSIVSSNCYLHLNLLSIVFHFTRGWSKRGREMKVKMKRGGGGEKERKARTN